jgi:hypothetical protein
MCNGKRVMDQLEKGKKVLNSIFTRFGTSNTVSPQTPAFAGGEGIHGEKKISNREKKK